MFSEIKAIFLRSRATMVTDLLGLSVIFSLLFAALHITSPL